ncbi:Uma2 family endonuclease [Pleurocapsa sp. PCC 7319]|uniref:Uma2 family endonuclease n=1 Tax=Pleurocapsa sp. PCC 7319 TaxID=118161 RepID=UPI0003485B2C|nr:Uma2 family endonuclease [Pleurocapsa sp. PCC 7319]
MSLSLVSESSNRLVLQMSPAWEMSADSFFDFCQLNSHLCIERTATGKLIIMSPAGSETGNRNFRLIQQLANWTDQDGSGIGFDSSAGFILPNGATRSPDASWIRLTKWNSLSAEQKTKFAPICPDFVVELRSPSDSLRVLQEKMQEYINNGASLGWLIDRTTRQVFIYTPNSAVKCLDNPQTVSGNPMLAGFVLNLEKIW